MRIPLTGAFVLNMASRRELSPEFFVFDSFHRVPFAHFSTPRLSLSHHSFLSLGRLAFTTMAQGS